MIFERNFLHPIFSGTFHKIFTFYLNVQDFWKIGGILPEISGMEFSKTVDWCAFSVLFHKIFAFYLVMQDFLFEIANVLYSINLSIPPKPLINKGFWRYV